MKSRRPPGRAAAIPVLLVALAAPLAQAGPLSEIDVTAGRHPAASTRALAARARADAVLRRLARPSSVDERYDVPAFLWATPRAGSAAGVARAGAAAGGAAPAASRASVEAAARRHLGQVALFYRLQAADVAEAPLRYVHDTGRGGIIAAFRQSVDGIEVFRDEVKVLMDRGLGLAAVSGYIPSRALVARAGGPEFKLSAARALHVALDDFAGRPVPGELASAAGAGEGGFPRYDVSAAVEGLPEGLRPGGPVRVKRTLFHLPDALVPAWFVEIMAPDQAYTYVVDAGDGRLLFRHDIMAFDSFSYRAWAEPSGAGLPHDGPQGTSPSPHPTGLPDFFAPPFESPNLLTLQNGLISTSDPWLAPGATTTSGNNVWAYADLASPDGYGVGDLIATTTAANTFDRTYDVNQAPGASSDQRMASITQLFYDNNFFHDWYYDSGFDEASGNGQNDNYGRGGLGGDAMRSEAQDFGGTNNANMSTPPDGSPGRMQMYVFNPGGASKLTVNSPPSVAGDYATGVATGFGAQNFDLTGDLVLGVDGIAPTGDGCSGLTNPVAGKIVMVDRGNCAFLLKAQNAQAAGAVGVIIADNVSGSTPPGMGGTGGGVTIPVLSVTLATGNLLKAALATDPVQVRMQRQTSLSRDGTLDNQIVAHEWGHFISNRLVGDASGLSTQMAGGLGEGWADFHGLLMTVRPEDRLVAANADWAGVYALAGYALYPSVGTTNAFYFGIRRVPYSTDMSKNALTFRHIENGVALPVGPPTAFGQTGTSNAEVHNTGEVWCTMLWECYAALLRDDFRLTFAQSQQLMRDYLVAAYKLTPNAPTLLEARDALLAAAVVTDLNDFQLFWQAFARRGAGVGAVAPDRFDVNNSGVVESYLTGGDLQVADQSLDVDLHDCDGDGYLDNNEVGHVTVTLANMGSINLSGTTLSLSSTNPHVLFPSGNSASFAPTTPFTTTSVTLLVELSGASGSELVDIVASYTDPDLAVPGVRQSTLDLYGNTDDVPSPIETVEALAPLWTAAGTPLADGQWGTFEAGPLDHRFRGPDLGTVGDHTLTSPPLQVSASGSFSFTFQTAWDFEHDGSTYFDGGVVELSTNGGGTWTDIGASLSPGYGGTLVSNSGNPLGGRSAYVAQSGGYASLVPVTASLGTAYQGQSVRIRFRVACDAGVGAAGWDVDDLTFTGLDNLPFLDVGPNAVDCTPVAVGGTAPTALSFARTGPHPAPGAVSFRYGMPRAGRVEIAIFDVSGRRVASLAGGEQPAGWHTAEWTVNDDGTAPASGVYFARFSADGRTIIDRVVRTR